MIPLRIDCYKWSKKFGYLYSYFIFNGVEEEKQPQHLKIRNKYLI